MPLRSGLVSIESQAGAVGDPGSHEGGPRWMAEASE
jgi:hypothetical protein